MTSLGTDLAANYKRVFGYDPREVQLTDSKEIAEALEELSILGRRPLGVTLLGVPVIIDETFGPDEFRFEGQG